jgi:hypothetical protein
VAAEDKALVAGPEGRMPLKLSEKHFQRVVDTLDTSIEPFTHKEIKTRKILKTSKTVLFRVTYFFKKILIVIVSND